MWPFPRSLLDLKERERKSERSRVTVSPLTTRFERERERGKKREWSRVLFPHYYEIGERGRGAEWLYPHYY